MSEQQQEQQEQQQQDHCEPCHQEDQGPGALEKSKQFVGNLFNWKIFWWEFFGTAIFAHGISASDNQDYYVTLSLLAALLIVAPFSGGHVNPAVSFGFFIKNGIIPDENGNTAWHWRDLFGRSLAQLLGACTGGASAFLILGMSAAPSLPSDDISKLGGYFTGEALGTFFFVLTILIMTDDRTRLISKVGEKVDSLAVLLTIAVALHFSRAFTYKTGGGLNPGIAIGLQLWLAIDTQDWSVLNGSWLFLVAPLVGALLSSYYYSFFHLGAVTKTGCFALNKQNQQDDQCQQQQCNEDTEKQQQ